MADVRQADVKVWEGQVIRVASRIVFERCAMDYPHNPLVSNGGGGAVVGWSDLQILAQAVYSLHEAKDALVDEE